jgi:hypothetical protein
MTTTYQQRVAMQWSIVGITSCLAILCFLAALYRKLDVEQIGGSASGRRYLQELSQLSPSEWIHHNHVQIALGSEQDERKLQNSSIVCNGHVNLCDRRVNEITFATVHNAMSALEDGAILLKNHFREFEGALQSGYRGINFDMGVCNGKVRLIHTVCTLKSRSLQGALQSIVRFMQANPNEVIILPTQLSTQLDEKNVVTLNAIDQVFQSVPDFYRLLYNHPSSNPLWPTLRELITTNRRILFFHYNGETCTKSDITMNTTNMNNINNPCPYGFHPWFLYAAETEFSFKAVNDLKDVNRACRITRGAGGSMDFFGVNVFLTPARFVPTLKRVNQYAFMKSHVDNCLAYNNKTIANLILVNYWGVGNVLNVVSDFNDVLR